jgi:hypothetical protein
LAAASTPSSLIFFNLCKVDLAARAGGVLIDYSIDNLLLLNLPGTSSNGLLAAIALPDTNSNSSHGLLLDCQGKVID